MPRQWKNVGRERAFAEVMLNGIERADAARRFGRQWCVADGVQFLRNGAGHDRRAGATQAPARCSSAGWSCCGATTRRDGELQALRSLFEQRSAREFISLQEGEAESVEHTSSIYSGIVRMLDPALGSEAHALEGMFLIAPDGREGEVREQLVRPAFSRVPDLKVRYLPYGELKANREMIAKFGHGMKPIRAISRELV
ncbi:hypothetical protein JYK14_06445 [Siccirubricoccus sp. KC 17139]|uniref:Uncharacterized protein n=1 Tax=Siccirubricoccus soli TaxID=2899147 RepID=A0ABT1D4B0_9PROT|nr:hypothetical protein [Siccirubricoccus soli]MCP2681947.1 hypothetical protein [Siccirubricoccus soli]